MMSKKQWLWCAEHHDAISLISIIILSLLVMVYLYTGFVRLFDSGKAWPIYLHSGAAAIKKFNCESDVIRDMFIPSGNKILKLKGDMRNYIPEPLERMDGRLKYLEFYASSTIGSEILDYSPECLGAFIADLKNYPKPFAMLIVDRKTGKTIFRIARLNDYLDR